MYLHAAIWVRAAWVLELSIVHAVHSTNSRSMLISAYESAIASCTIWCSAMTLPCDSRLEGPLTHHVEGALALGDGPHGVVDPAATETALRQHLGAVLRAEQVVKGHPDVGVADVVVRGRVRHDLDARRLAGHDEDPVRAHHEEDVGTRARPR